MARGASERDWETTSFLAALVYNAHAAKGKAKKASDFNPFSLEKKAQKRVSFDEFVRTLPPGELRI